MSEERPEEFERAIEQIRDGKLDGMLSQMFGGEAEGETDGLIVARENRAQNGLNGHGRRIKFFSMLAIMALAGGLIVGWFTRDLRAADERDEQAAAAQNQLDELRDQIPAAEARLKIDRESLGSERTAIERREAQLIVQEEQLRARREQARQLRQTLLEREAALASERDDLDNALLAFQDDQTQVVRMADQYREENARLIALAAELEGQTKDYGELLINYEPKIEAAIGDRETYDAMIALGIMSDFLTNTDFKNDGELVHNYADLIRMLVDQIQKEAEEQDPEREEEPASGEDPPAHTAG